MSKPWVGLRPLCLGLITTVAGHAGLPSEKELWFEGRSAHFRFVTNGSEQEARERSRSLEILYEILKVLSPDLRQRRIPVRPQPPTYVYLFSSPRTFQAYSELSGIEGYFVKHPDGYYIAMESGGRDATGTAYHEYLHQFLEANFPGVPPWLNEGLACYFETMKLDGPEIRLGAPPESDLRLLHTLGILPVARLLGVSTHSPDYTRDPDRARFYASAWLLTDYLMTGAEARRAQVGTYLDLIRSGRSVDACFAGAFDLPPEVLDRELKAYLDLLVLRRTIMTWVIQFKSLAPDPTFTYGPLPRSEALGRLGLLLATGNRPTQDRALEHFQAALALDPGSVSGNFGRGLLALLDNRPAEAGPFFDRASQGDPDNALTHYFAGASLIQGVYLKGSGPEVARADLARARDHLLRAVEQGCPNPDAIIQLASVVLDNDHPSPQELAKLEKACGLLPGQYGLKFNLAILYLRASQQDLARGHFQEVADQTADPDLATQAATQLQAMATRAAAQLQAVANQDAERFRQKGMEAFRQNRYEEAVAAMEKALTLTQDPRQKADLQENLDRMKILIALRTRPPASKGRKP